MTSNSKRVSESGFTFRSSSTGSACAIKMADKTSDVVSDSIVSWSRSGQDQSTQDV